MRNKPHSALIQRLQGKPHISNFDIQSRRIILRIYNHKPVLSLVCTSNAHSLSSPRGLELRIWGNGSELLEA
jgi:hypothetical protein